jgi:hypothetical protein
MLIGLAELVAERYIFFPFLNPEFLFDLYAESYLARYGRAML